MHVLRVLWCQGRLAFNLLSNKLRGRRMVEYKTWVVVGLKWGAEHGRRIRHRNRKFLADVAMTNVHTVVVLRPVLAPVALAVCNACYFAF